RVYSRGLRHKLREYYAGAPRSAVVISVPKGSYTAVFGTGTTEHAVAPVRGERAALSWGWVVAIPSLLIAGGVCAVPRLAMDIRTDAPRLLTVTSMPGAEEDPSLSPDGKWVAFSSAPGTDAVSDIWVKAVEGDAT